MLPPRQRDEARALLARAMRSTQPGGRILACISNNEGARSGRSGSRAHRRPGHDADEEQVSRVLERAARRAARRRARGTNGCSWTPCDRSATVASSAGPACSRGTGSTSPLQLLAAHLPPDLAGRAADLGAGFGYLSVELLERCAGIAALDVYEAERRALDLARRNLAAFESRATIRYCWHDVTAGLTDRYDAIVCNPPFHTHARADRPDVGRRFIAAAAAGVAAGRSAVAGRESSPAVRARARRWIRAGPHRDAAARLQDRRSGEGEARVKLLKLIANLGYGSRKEVTAMFRDGRIADVDGQRAVGRRRRRIRSACGSTVSRSILPPGLVLMLHKPIGYTCSTQDAGALVYDLLPPRFRRRSPTLATVGRLDRDTTGLLLMTDDGALLHRIVSPKRRTWRRSTRRRWRATCAATKPRSSRAAS